MDWLHQVRADAKQRRKSKGQSLAQYLRVVEGNAEQPGEGESVPPERKRDNDPTRRGHFEITNCDFKERVKNSGI